MLRVPSAEHYEEEETEKSLRPNRRQKKPKSGAAEDAFDAQIDPPVDKDAQQPLTTPDIVPDIIDTHSNVVVIDAPSSDPPAKSINSSSNILKSSSEDKSLSPSASDKESQDLTETTVSPIQAADDAKTESLSSQSAPVAPVILTPGALTIPESLAAQSPADGVQMASAGLTTDDSGMTVPPLQEEGKQIIEPNLTLATPVGDWCNHVKGFGKRLSKKGEAFTLPSGEACVKIPNSVIEKNMKSWEPIVLGQFYSDRPSQGTLHNIVNVI